MSLIISDDTLRAWDMTEEEFKLELAVMLFQAGKMAVGRASTLAGMEKAQFCELLKSRQIPLYYYDVEDFELDLKNLRELGRL